MQDIHPSLQQLTLQHYNARDGHFQLQKQAFCASRKGTQQLAQGCFGSEHAFLQQLTLRYTTILEMGFPGFRSKHFVHQGGATHQLAQAMAK
jgi:hypothetical protein